MKKQNETIDVEIIEKGSIILAPFSDLDLVEGVDLDELLKKYDKVPQIDPEADNAGEEYQYVLAGHKAFVKARGKIEKVRVIIKAPALEFGRDVDSRAKILQEKIHDKEIELFTQRKLVEDNEQRKQDEAVEAESIRVKKHTDKMRDINMLPSSSITIPSKEIAEIIGRLKVMDKSEKAFEEYSEEATKVIDASIVSLESLYHTKVSAENAEVILREADEKRKKEEASLEKEKAKERAEFEVEKKKLKEEKDAFNRRMNAEEEERRKKLAVEEAEELEKEQKEETEKLEKEQKEDAKALKKQKELGIAKAQQEAFDFLKWLTNDKDTASQVLEYIIAEKVPHIKFTYGEE